MSSVRIFDLLLSSADRMAAACAANAVADKCGSTQERMDSSIHAARCREDYRAIVRAVSDLPGVPACPALPCPVSVRIDSGGAYHHPCPPPPFAGAGSCCGWDYVPAVCAPPPVPADACPYVPRPQSFVGNEIKNRPMPAR